MGSRIKGITQKEIDDWLIFCDDVQKSTSHRLHEKKHEREARIEYLLKPENYGEFFMYYFPMYCDNGKTQCSRYQIRNRMRLEEMKQEITLLQLHHRQSAKSTHANMGYPTHMMLNDDMWFAVIMGFNEKKAARLLKGTQAQLKSNQKVINDFGVQFSHGDWAEGSFVTTKGVAFHSMSYIQDPAGLLEGANRPDYCNVDDVDNRKKARNKVLVREAVDNIISNLSEGMRFDRVRLVISNNRKVKGGIVDTIIEDIGKKETTVLSVVNAVDKKGNSTWPERYSNAYWKKKKANKTYRVWEREYMNNPIEDGYIFKPEWIRWKPPLGDLRDYDCLVLYGDLSYTDSGDLKSLHLVGKKGRELHVLEAFNRQTSTTNAARWLYDLHEDKLRGLDVIYMIEANFIQGMYLNDFDEEGDVRGYYLPIRGDKRTKGNKFDRIENMSPVFERGYVYFNEEQKKNVDFTTCIDCILAFEKGSGAPDDPPDSLEGAFFEINRRASNPVSRIRVIERKSSFVD